MQPYRPAPQHGSGPASNRCLSFPLPPPPSPLPSAYTSRLEVDLALHCATDQYVGQPEEPAATHAEVGAIDAQGALESDPPVTIGRGDACPPPRQLDLDLPGHVADGQRPGDDRTPSVDPNHVHRERDLRKAGRIEVVRAAQMAVTESIRCPDGCDGETHFSGAPGGVRTLDDPPAEPGEAPAHCPPAEKGHREADGRPFAIDRVGSGGGHTNGVMRGGREGQSRSDDGG